MKRIFAVGAVMVLGLLLPSLAMADPVLVGDIIKIIDAYPAPRSSGGGFWGGGEFTLVDVTQGFSFGTFCLETREDIAFNHNYTVDNVSQWVYNNGTGAGIALNDKAAYLFWLFAHNSLPGYVSSSQASQQALQAAIWHFQSQVGYVAWSNAFVTLADTADPGLIAAAFAQVVVINPVTVNPNGSVTLNQSVLQVPVPEPGTLILVGFGLVGLGLARRRK